MSTSKILLVELDDVYTELFILIDKAEMLSRSEKDSLHVALNRWFESRSRDIMLDDEILASNPGSLSGPRKKLALFRRRILSALSAL